MRKPSVNQVHRSLRDSFRKEMPDGREIAARAVRQALGSHGKNKKWIKQNFSRLVEEVQASAYKSYLRGEQNAGSEALKEVFSRIAGRKTSADKIIDLLGKHFYALDRFFLGLTQGRRPRAGKVFEYLLRELIIILGYPFTPQPVINGQPDFIFPSIEHFKKHAMDCIIFTVKRTLRERWRQIVTEGTHGLGFFLATIDEDISQRDLDEMLRSRITLVVPARIKEGLTKYKQAKNVITFELFFKYYLDPALKRWHVAGVTPQNERSGRVGRGKRIGR